VVLSPVGYTYIEEGNIIKIVSNESLQQEPGATEVFILNNAKASDIKPTIDGLVDAATGGKIVIDNRSNALVITERPSRMGRIRTIIEQLDKATDQVMIESKFVEVTDRDIRDIGVNWASLQGMQFGVGQIQQSFTRSRTQQASDSAGDTRTYVTIPTTINPANGGFAQSTLNLDSAHVTDLPPSVPGTTAVAGYTNSGGVATFTAPTTYNGLTTLLNTGDTARVATAVFSASDFNMIVSALKTQNNTKIVSNPTVVTLNNTEASLNIGEEFPIPSYTYNSERGSFEVSGFTYKPIGVILKVTPQVNGRGVIKLTIEPEVSQRNGSSSFGGAGGASIPIIATRKAKTQVSLKDGYTMGIGGLITSTQDHGGSKVPVLGSIPVLGRLFSSKSVNDTVSNLLIFITAKTVSADGASPEEVFDPRAVSAVGMSRDDLPGFRSAKGSDLFAHPVPYEKK
jgi:type IV pilus assembly protein PilQ